MPGLRPNLCYTIALDKPGEVIHRRMARLLVTSLIRTHWHGRIVVFHNHPIPVLPEGHPDVEEQGLQAYGASSFKEITGLKYRVRDQLDVTGINKVLFLDCDCLALRSINHLMAGSWDIYAAPEPGCIVEVPFNGHLTDEEMNCLLGKNGINSGVIGIRAALFHEIMADWERLDAKEQIRHSHHYDQHSWNRLLLDTRHRQRHFAHGEVQFPFLHRAVWADYHQAALVHAADMQPEEKFELLYGLWVGRFAQGEFEEITSPGRAAELPEHLDCAEESR